MRGKPLGSAMQPPVHEVHYSAEGLRQSYLLAE